MGSTVSTTNQIEMTNRQNIENYEANKALNEAQMLMTLDKANTAIDETLRQGFWAKVDIEQKDKSIESKLMIHRGEGITAGNSTAREVRTFLTKESSDIANVDSVLKNKVATIWDKANQQVDSLYLKTVNQYYTAKNNMYTEDEAGTLIGGAMFSDVVSLGSSFI